jgi:hypothetical protein
VPIVGGVVHENYAPLLLRKTLGQPRSEFENPVERVLVNLELRPPTVHLLNGDQLTTEDLAHRPEARCGVVPRAEFQHGSFARCNAGQQSGEMAAPGKPFIFPSFVRLHKDQNFQWFAL